jgi:hypothetical protein
LARRSGPNSKPQALQRAARISMHVLEIAFDVAAPQAQLACQR